ncbi:MAG: hypothetical protein GKS06_13350 [Acidobacteria bacterium]|nr:hypothetical protein [Acidobacteriota bacterium]
MAAAPKTQPEKVLVVGYWFQVYGAQDDIDSYSVNRELKHLGHGIPKITRAFNGLIEQRPQLAIQVRKSGKSRQARKKYRITAAGVARVEDMLRVIGD